MLFLILLFNIAMATTRIAVLDTGVDLTKANVPLCPTGHKDFTIDNNPLIDKLTHGSNIVDVIYQNSNKDICFIIVKFCTALDCKDETKYQKALSYISTLPNIKLLNLSISGEGYDGIETFFIKRILDNGVSIVAAAGNKSSILSYSKKQCNFYPACSDKRIWVIGNKHSSSNYGNLNDGIDLALDGVEVLGAGIRLTGTSQAAAIFSGKLSKENNTCY